MLKLTLPETEVYDESRNEFVLLPKVKLKLEHSLVSLSKWESIHKKAFMGPNQKTQEETISYIECMCLGSNPQGLRTRLTQDQLTTINQYISDKATATTFREIPGQQGSREVVTAEIIYYWMVAMNVPLECENWHLDKLFSLLRVISLKSAPAKKMSRNELIARNRELNAQRRAALNTTG